MKLTCTVIDDELLAVSLLEAYILKTPFLELKGTYNSAINALSDLSVAPVDLLLLDIQMPELNGMEFSRMLPENIRVIFTTAFFIKADRKLIQVGLNKILYIEGLKDYVKIYIEGELHPLLSLMSMKSMEEMLPESRFIRVHRSYIVQSEKIKVIDRNRIVFGKEYIAMKINLSNFFHGIHCFQTKSRIYFRVR